MNREEGHYIINMEKEVKGQDKNEGYVNKFYISPPGNINYGVTATKENNYVISAGTDLQDTGTCKVLNQSIQTHFVFKVVTREDDITPVMKPVNV